MSRNYIRPLGMNFVPHGVQGQQFQDQEFIQLPQKTEQQNQAQETSNNLIEPKIEDTKEGTVSTENPEKPPWMKKVKRISNKERRRRQNQNLRRLVTPKSALMVLNEMVPGMQLAFKVEPALPTKFNHMHNVMFCAEVIFDGVTYKGFGETKTAARNAAAEQAVRDIIIKKMTRTFSEDKPQEAESANGEESMDTGEEEPMPMIQIASFALHKLFSEWEGEGHRVPQFRPPNNSVSESGDMDTATQAPNAPQVSKKKVKTLPENAASMHPCMLLTYMRPQQEYKELGVQGDRPQNLTYTIAVEVDGSRFVGQGQNKKEARKWAAAQACKALFDIDFKL
ncbi:unnamed protein product [Leptosia nina]|uniref:DRBM domain-containing protein n=1 Tax=Leptosia nina TaxID=320188 RepID=A0AAV1JPH7_9NEOP